MLPILEFADEPEMIYLGPLEGYDCQAALLDAGSSPDARMMSLPDAGPVADTGDAGMMSMSDANADAFGSPDAP